MTRRIRDAAWWADAVRRYEAGEISLLAGGKEAGMDRERFRRRLVDLGATIKRANGQPARVIDVRKLEALIRRYEAGEKGVTMEYIAAEMRITYRVARDEVASRGVFVRRGVRGSREEETPRRPPACRHCGFLVGSRCRCPEHAANRRRA